MDTELLKAIAAVRAELREVMTKQIRGEASQIEVMAVANRLYALYQCISTREVEDAAA